MSQFRRKIFTADRAYSLVIAFIFTTCKTLSDEGRTFRIWEKDYFSLGKFSSFKSTIASGSKFIWFTFNLLLDCNVGRYLVKYSIRHLFQNLFDIATSCFYLLQLYMSTQFSLIIVPLLYLPSRIWFSESGSRSSGLSLT